MSNTIELSADQRAKVTAVIAADAKVEEWQGTAFDRWTAVMTDDSGEMTDDKVNIALRADYITKRLAGARRDKGENLTTKEVEEVTLSAKNVWKNKRSQVKKALTVPTDKSVTPESKSDKGAAERRAEARGAIRRALAAGVALDDIIADAREEASKLGK